MDLAAEAVTLARYLDVGALVLQLRGVPWQVPGFSLDTHEEVLRRIHAWIVRIGSFDVRSHRLLVRAQAPRQFGWHVLVRGLNREGSGW